MKLSWTGAIFIIVGILVLVLPNIIEYLIGIGLIVIGILSFFTKRIIWGVPYTNTTLINTYLINLSTGDAITCLLNMSSNPRACSYRLLFLPLRYFPCKLQLYSIWYTDGDIIYREAHLWECMLILLPLYYW